MLDCFFLREDVLGVSFFGTDFSSDSPFSPLRFLLALPLPAPAPRTSSLDGEPIPPRDRPPPGPGRRRGSRADSYTLFRKPSGASVLSYRNPVRLTTGGPEPTQQPGPLARSLREQVSDDPLRFD